jgi:hypothetical protein
MAYCKPQSWNSSEEAVKDHENHRILGFPSLIPTSYIPNAVLKHCLSANHVGQLECNVELFTAPLSRQ